MPKILIEITEQDFNFLKRQVSLGWGQPIEQIIVEKGIVLDNCNHCISNGTAISKANYETRLKADLVAMLTEIQMEIEELENPFGTRISGCSQDGWKHGVKNCDFVIQQKINALKGIEDGNDD